MKIALFFTEGMSLRGWHEAGLLHRDSALYEQLGAAGHEVVFVTYGFADDPEFLPQGSPIQVLTRPPDMGQREYSWKIHQIHRAELADVDVIKSHQVTGARYAAYARWKLGIRHYIARCGYLPSYFMQQEGAPRSRKIRNWLEEFMSFHLASAICVPSHAEIDYLRRRYRINSKKAHPCPNWVDANVFRPDEGIKKHARRICFVGRFHAQKDPLLLLDALQGMEDIELLMIGGGPLRPQIEQRIAQAGMNVTLLDRVNNEDLPRYLNASALYALPTRYEGGSPKTLFEAMACEVPVVSTDGFGVDEAFQDGVQGYKIPVGNASALRDAIQKLLDDPERARDMGRAGRQYVIENFSVERAFQREVNLLASLRSIG
jgi:glycosyltransferase involved in cell wall biosynthesis